MKILIIAIFSVNTFFAQNNEELRDINMIITINKEITFDLKNIRIGDNSGRIISTIKYEPGNFLLSEKLYNQIISDTEENYYLYFDHHTSNNQINCYQINLIKDVFINSSYQRFFCVVEIFNIKERKYRKKIKRAGVDKDYIYSFIMPGYSIHRF